MWLFFSRFSCLDMKVEKVDEDFVGGKWIGIYKN